MGTTSTIPSVKTRLRELLEAAVPSGWVVSYGRPPHGQPARKVIYLADVALDLDITVSKGPATVRRTRDERYTIDVLVYVLEDRGTVEAVEAEAFAGAAVVEDVVAGDFTLGFTGAEIEHATMRGPGTVESGYSDSAPGGPLAVIKLPVRVVARLT